MIPVYISHPTPHTLQQLRIVNGVKNVFLKRDLYCDNVYVSDNSILLDSIRNAIKCCFGIVAVAFERKYIESGINRRKADIEGIVPEKMNSVSETSPFIHIETSMAYAFDLPVLVIKEKDLLPEGVLDDAYNGIDRLDFDIHNPAFLEELNLSKALHSFLQKVYSKYQDNGGRAQ